MPSVQQIPPPAFAQQAPPPIFATLQPGGAPPMSFAQPPLQSAYSTDKINNGPYASVPTAHYSGSGQNQMPVAAGPPSKIAWWHRLSRTFKILIVLLVVAILAGLGAGLGVGLSHKKSSGSGSTSSSAQLSVQQVFTTCSKTTACSKDSSGMSTLITCSGAGSLSATCCNAMFGLSSSCSACIISYPSGETVYGTHVQVCGS